MPDPIQHIVVLMFENHSFDQMLGYLGTVPGANVNGADSARFNKDATGQCYYQTVADPSIVDPDPKHETVNVLNQIAGGCSGFVADYEGGYVNTSSPTNPGNRQKIMSFFRQYSLPALHALAENFAVCDNWFSSVPGPTWANRFFVHSGTSLGHVRMPDDFSHPEEFLGYDQNTIYELLNAKNISWRIYFGDLPQSIVLQRQWKAKNRHNYRIMERFYIDAAGPPDDFPEYVFIEPRYYNSLQLEGPQNDDHPPHPPGPAQELLAAVYNSLRRNEDLWNSTLLVVLYDEHGGFYDHVTPPAAIPPDACNVDGFDFKQLGMRVPAILASPYVGKGVVIKTVFDHTSLLRYLIDKWNLGPLTARSCAANSISAAIMNFPQAHTLESLPLPPPPPVAPQSQVALAMAPLPLNEHQKVLIEFTKLMDRRPMLPLPLNLSPMGAQLVAFEPLSELSAAKRRMAAFLQ